jgi:cytidine deaminase
MAGACPVAAVKDKSMTDEHLLDLARAAAAKAYAPYSNFHVGCAIESVDGEVVTGANMENACYRLGICAEQSALTAAQHKFGLSKVARIAVVGGTDATVCTPCGGCRQAILEAAQLSGRDVEIICGSGNGSGVERHRIGELIPFGFGPANLEGPA